MTMKPNTKFWWLLLTIPVLMTLLLLLPGIGNAQEFDFAHESYAGVVIL